MSLEPKKLIKYALMALVAIAALIFAVHTYRVVKNKPNIANLLAIAGIAGPKVYTLEPSPELRLEIEKAAANPQQLVEHLEKALDAKMLEYARKRNELSDKSSPAAKSAFESSYAYAMRIIMLKKWKPGMTKDEIAKHYAAMTKPLNMQYDFKNHCEDFLGFK